MSIEVGVVGAGFVGSYYSMHLAKRGVNVIIFEEDRIVGTPHCSGLIGITGLNRLGIHDLIRREGLINNKISVAKFFTQSGKYFKLDMKKPVAYVLDREELDRLIFGKALDYGAEAMLGYRVMKIDQDGLLKTKKEEYKCEVVVDAEGPRRVLIRNFSGVTLDGLLPAFQIDVFSKSSLPTNTVELHFLVPDFFLWIIPVDEEGTVWRVGGATKKRSRYLKRMVLSLARKRLRRFKIRRKFGGIVVSKGNLRRFVWNRVIAIGDAAGHVKPTTGGGVIVGGLGAFIAAIVTKKFLEGKSELTEYEEFWYRLFYRDMKLMKLMRFLLNTLGNHGIDFVGHFIPKNALSGLRGDFDFQSEAILRLLKLRK